MAPAPAVPPDVACFLLPFLGWLCDISTIWGVGGWFVFVFTVNPLPSPKYTRFARFATELNELGWSSEMARWKATSKGFPTGHLRRPSEVVEVDLEQHKVGMEVGYGWKWETPPVVVKAQGGGGAL